MFDIHLHVLPGLDDGPAEMSESVEMCRMALRDGTNTLVATPHIYCNAGNPSIDEIRHVCKSLQDSLKSGNVKIEIKYAAEVSMVEDLAERIKAGEVPTFDLQGRYVLVEPDRMGGCAEYLSELVFRLQLKDITPVIAHPENIRAFQLDPSLARRLVGQGALMQVTASSIVRADSEVESNFLVNWLREGLVHFVASDAHDTVSRPPILSEARRICCKLFGNSTANLLFDVNPCRILAGEDVICTGTIDRL